MEHIMHRQLHMARVTIRMWPHTFSLGQSFVPASFCCYVTHLGQYSLLWATRNVLLLSNVSAQAMHVGSRSVLSNGRAAPPFASVRF